MERLEEGLEGGWIPGQLRKLIEEDTDFGYQRIEQRTWVADGWAARQPLVRPSRASSTSTSASASAAIPTAVAD
jgi:hypothetical protein